MSAISYRNTHLVQCSIPPFCPKEFYDKYNRIKIPFSINPTTVSSTVAPSSISSTRVTNTFSSHMPTGSTTTRTSSSMTPSSISSTRVTSTFTSYSPTRPITTRTSSSARIITTSAATSTTPSAFSSALSTSNPMFSRPNGTGSNFYYEAIQTTTYISGTYTLRSISSMDTYGCLYSTSFNPSYPTFNLIKCDDNSSGSYQFLINSTLGYGSTYILVVTTYSVAVTGSYSITAVGPGSVYMRSLPPVASAL